MNLVGSRSQQQQDDYYDYSGTIATGNTPQLLLPQRKSCSHLMIANLSSGTMYLQFGIRRATPTVVNGVVTAIAVADAGFGFLQAPAIEILGGGDQMAPGMLGATMPNWPAVARPAVAIANMQASSISGLDIASITVLDGGAGYLDEPYVFVRATRNDAYGVGIPSATVGIPILPSQTMVWNGTACPTSAISIFGPDTAAPYTVKWLP